MIARPHRAPHLTPLPVEKPSRRQVCAVPLCGRVLAERNRSGLCKAHIHHLGITWGFASVTPASGGGSGTVDTAVPIHPENCHRYPPDWPAISTRFAIALGTGTRLALVPAALAV
jgi:hypothetical protein